MIAITTFSATGYQQYGKRMLESVIENWPSKIIVYTESPIDLKHEKIEERDFFSIPGVQAYYQYLKNVPVAHGKVNGSYNYNFDAWKFTRKVFAQYDVLQDLIKRQNLPDDEFNEYKIYGEQVFWIDADCVIQKSCDEQFLSGLVEEAGIAYLGREGFYTETGFIGFNTEAEGFSDFLDKYIGCLRRGVLFKLPRWHDCEAFDWARSFNHCKENNLSPWFNLSTFPKSSEGRPMVGLDDLDVMSKSVLGPYIKHHKGPRKMIAAAHAA